jgi:hypothetical protein
MRIQSDLDHQDKTNSLCHNIDKFSRKIDDLEDGDRQAERRYGIDGDLRLKTLVDRLCHCAFETGRLSGIGICAKECVEKGRQIGRLEKRRVVSSGL